MDVIFDWKLGNMIYNGLITLRLFGFPFAEIGVVSIGAMMNHGVTRREQKEGTLMIVS
jgi:hypothetical protein